MMINLNVFLQMQEYCIWMCAQSFKSCVTLCDPMECNPPGSSVHGILQARILEWVAISFSRGSSQPRNRLCLSSSPALADRLFTTRASLVAQMVKCLPAVWETWVWSLGWEDPLDLPLGSLPLVPPNQIHEYGNLLEQCGLVEIYFVKFSRSYIL